MRLEDQRESQNVEDRRGQRFARPAGIGIGAVLLVVVFGLVTGQDPSRLLQLLQETQVAEQQEVPDAGGPPAGDQLGTFASRVLGSTEDAWSAVFREGGSGYREPRLVLFSDAVQSACGFTSAAVGPFYCPRDQKVYLDLAFFDELSRRFGAPGDFAQAYVIAHEVGHHVQNLLGIADQVTEAQQSAGSEAEANRYSVALELQADCLAGVWANRANRMKDEKLIEPGDVEEGLQAAAAIGDDRMQSLSQGYVQPESWTHGSSAQRVEWLRRGIRSGDPNACKTL
jgi:predicted metalloprotease